MVEGISQSIQEQSVGIMQVNDAMSKIDNVTQQNAALVEESAAAASGMAEQAGKLSELVTFFDIESDVSTANATVQRVVSSIASRDDN